MDQKVMLTPEELKELPRDEMMELFKTLPLPAPGELDGEYLFHFAHHGDETVKEFIKTAKNPDQPLGVLTYKAFKPLAPLSENKGIGYLGFQKKDGSMNRLFWFDTEIAKSGHDGKDALHMVFGVLKDEDPNASLPPNPVVDEVRKYEDGVFIAVGAVVQDDGSYGQPAPYLLTGPEHPFRGKVSSIAKQKI